MAISAYIKSLREKIGFAPLIVPSVTALVFDEANRVLLHRATDDGLWHTVGGAIDPDEQPAHAAVRETYEETGLTILPEAVTGVYTRPPAIYPNGEICHYIAIAFRCRVVAGNLEIRDDESLELRFFARHELPELSEIDRLTVQHGFAYVGKVYFEA